MTDRPEVNSQNGSDVDACAELAFDDSSTTVLPELDSADIIPEAAMKCGILPLDGSTMAELNDDVPSENLCQYIRIVMLTTDGQDYLTDTLGITVCLYRTRSTSVVLN